MATQFTAAPAITSTQPASAQGNSQVGNPTSTESGQAITPPKDDGYVPGQSANKSAFTSRYSQATSFLPASVSSRLPSAEAAEQHVGGLTAKFGAITGVAADKATTMARSGSERMKGIDLDQFKGRLTPELVTKCAWSVRNETQVALNVSLNQVGPLMYEVLGPNDVFERRCPPVWYALEIRPFTNKDTAYTPWSVTWPIIAVTGPVVATVSLLAIPFAALAVGGSALASLTGLGTSAAAGASAAATSVVSYSATAASYAQKAAYLPGGKKMHGKLTDAANRQKVVLQKKAQDAIVGYIGKGVAGLAISGLVGGGGGGGAAGATEEEKRKAEAEVERRQEEELRGREKERVGKRGKKVDEVEVTGFELEKVLACETGKKKVDRHLEAAFRKLNLKINKGLKTTDNPVLRIVGGPELEERGKKTFLVFYPFQVEKIPDIEVVPLDPSEAPPTEAEATLIKDARVVETVDDAASINEKVPGYENGEAEAARKVDEAVEEIDSKKARSSENGKADVPGAKGWFAGWRG